MSLPPAYTARLNARSLLLLQFADAAGGLAALEACVEDIRCTMTVMGPGRATEYNCAFVQRDGNGVTFQQVCLDD